MGARFVLCLAAFAPTVFAGGNITINSTGDDSAGTGVECVAPAMTDICTLRAALEQAESNPGIADIDFNIGANDPAGNPNNCAAGVCTINVVIGGDSNQRLPRIRTALTLDGSTQPGNSGVCTNAIASRPTYGVVINGDGTAPGLVFGEEANGAAIRGLNISGFVDGVVFENASNNRLECSFIGTSADGTSALANRVGVTLVCDAADNTIGGTTPELGNLVSGNTEDGVRLFGGLSCGGPMDPNLAPDTNLIQNNLIGVASDGTSALGQPFSGISMYDGNVGSASGNIIRDNVIGANGTGIFMDQIATMTVIESNFIGTDVSGTADLGHTYAGVELFDTSNTTVGGAGVGNVIANNTLQGIYVTDADDDGINVPQNNRFSQNQISDNGELGIDLVPVDGVNANDVNDADSGTNGLQNSPEFVSTTFNGATIDITYFVQTSAASLTVEFFIADADGEEGETFLASDTYTGMGANEMVTIPAGGATASDILVATATDDTTGATSEFSANIQVPVELMQLEVE